MVTREFLEKYHAAQTIEYQQHVDETVARSMSVIDFTDMDPRSRVQLLESLMVDIVHGLITSRLIMS